MVKRKKCSYKHCRKAVKKGSTKCSMHLSREWRERNPARAKYITLKYNSKRRGKDFALSFEEFKAFAFECDYIAGAGRRSTSLHIDRINQEAGYTPDNIQVLTNRENGDKYRQYRKSIAVSYDDRGYPVEFTTTNNFRSGPLNLDPGEDEF